MPIDQRQPTSHVAGFFIGFGINTVIVGLWLLWEYGVGPVLVRWCP